MSSLPQLSGHRRRERRGRSHQRVRVLLACGYTLIRAGLRALLEQASSVEVVGEAGEMRGVLQLIVPKAADVLLFDLAVFGFDGLKTAAEAVREVPRLRIVALATQATPDQAQQILAAGATGLVLRYSPAPELFQAIQAVARGQTYLSRIIPRRPGEAARKVVNGLKDPLARLTARQRKVLQFLAESQTTKEIALELGLSAKTVEFHRAQLMRRLDIGDLPGLVRFALRAGLVEL